MTVSGLRFAVLAASLACASAPAAAYTTLFAFGDSLSDAGNLYILDGRTAPRPPYATPHFSNGPTWVEDLNNKLLHTTLTPSLLRGRDFAVAGAQTGPTAYNHYVPNPADLLGQVNAYALGHRGPEIGALYTLGIGGNDILGALDAYRLNPNPTTLNTLGTTVAQAEHNTVDAVEELWALNRRSLRLLFYEVPDLGLTPRVRSWGDGWPAFAGGLAWSFDQTVLKDLAPLETPAGGLHVFDLPTYTLLEDAVNHPLTYGFTNVTSPCWTGGFTGYAGGGTLCSAPDKYLFWDGVHPTAAANRLTAALAYNLLTGAAAPLFTAADPPAVPEASTWTMMLLGFAGLGWAGYRRRAMQALRSSIRSPRQHQFTIGYRPNIAARRNSAEGGRNLASSEG